jgi:hypothetical protein
VTAEVFNTPDPLKQVGNKPTDWARSKETAEHRRLREYALYLLVVTKGEG